MEGRKCIILLHYNGDGIERHSGGYYILYVALQSIQDIVV
jgi:hypothetical protein